MERQRQITIAQLQQEGVWDMNREAPMPVVVQRVAVVSSANAARSWPKVPTVST